MENPQSRGGEASRQSGKVSAAQLSRYLEGIDFPADKQTIIDTAKSNGAPDNIMQWMNRLPDREYNRANEIEEEFSKIT